MISILYIGNSNKAYDVKSCWDKLDPQIDTELMGDSYNKRFKLWLAKHNGKLRDDDVHNGYYLDFEDDTDALIFKLRFGL
jgi:hypothetical protein